MEQIESRVLALEASLRNWKRAVAVLAIAFSAFALLGWRRGAGPVSATEFTLVDQSGLAVADLSRDANGPKLRLFSPDGKRAVILFANDKRAVVATSTDELHQSMLVSSVAEGPALNMKNGTDNEANINFNGGPNLRLGRDKETFAGLASFPEGPSIMLAQGKKAYLRTVDDK